MGCIYKYTNKIHNHIYIGLTNNLKRRDNDHISASKNPKNRDYNLPFHRALRKYGRDNFDLSILEDNIPKDLLQEREIYWIKYYNAYEDKQHYNSTPGGDLPSKNTVHLGENHGMAILTLEEVKQCRLWYSEGKRSRDIYDNYFSNKLPYNSFLKMWHGITWKFVMPEVFNNNPHPGKYGYNDCITINELYKASGLSLNKFQKTKECYVGYGTLYKMINNPEFYKNK